MKKDYELFIDCKTFKTNNNNNAIFDYADSEDYEISEVKLITNEDDIYYCRCMKRIIFLLVIVKSNPKRSVKFFFVQEKIKIKNMN